jgi:hypothetical protein
MVKKRDILCEKTSWHGREAYVVGNDLVSLYSVAGGGHVADFHFNKSTGRPSVNPMWVPPWKPIEPQHYKHEKHGAKYGPLGVGKLLADIAGQNLCLDIFGVPSEVEMKHGLCIHGEAGVQKWQKVKARATNQEVALTLAVGLPVAGLKFTREIALCRGESVAYFSETVVNQRKADHFFHWTQHVTLGAPFVACGDTIIGIPATKGRTFPGGYDGDKLLEGDQDFQWPNAPKVGGQGTADLTRPFPEPGKGYVASVLLDPRRNIEYVSAVNTKLGLLIGYCFQRQDYPWCAIWHENCSRSYAPWSSRTQSLGLEFGASPLPIVRRDSFALGPLWGTPTYTMVDAKGKKTVNYVAFLAQVPPDFGGVSDIKLAPGEIIVCGTVAKEAVRVAASGLVGTGLLG